MSQHEYTMMRVFNVEGSGRITCVPDVQILATNWARSAQKHVQLTAVENVSC